MLVSHDMIVWCYRLFLAREPAPSDISHYLKKNASVAQLRRMFCHSNEFLNGARYAMLRDEAHYVSEFALLQQSDIVVTEDAVRHAHVLILNQPCADDDLAHYLNCEHLAHLLKSLCSSELYRASPVAGLINALPTNALKKINVLDLPSSCFKGDVAQKLSGQISFPEHLEAQLPNISIEWAIFSSRDVELFCDITLYSIPTIEIQLAGSCQIHIGLNCTGKWELCLLGETQVSIGNDTSVNHAVASMQSGSTLSIGRDCYFEGQTHFRMGDSHSVFSMENLEVLNYKTNPRIEIHDHVTAGQSTLFLADCVVEYGCVIEQASLLKGVFDKNSLIMGCPARVIQSNIVWSHSKIPSHLQQLARHA